MTDYDTLPTWQIDRLAANGDMSAELESRSRHLRVVEAHVTVCLRCGVEVASEHIYERRDTQERWRDPFAAPGVAMFTETHALFCEGRGLLGKIGFRRRPHVATLTVRFPQ